jgi:hypothetical protein
MPHDMIEFFSIVPFFHGLFNKIPIEDFAAYIRDELKKFDLWYKCN